MANERELVNCMKSVFISDSIHISSELSFLSEKYAWKKNKFVKGKDMLSPMWESWQFVYAEGSKIPEYFKAMLSSGIWDRLTIEIIAGRNKG